MTDKLVTLLQTLQGDEPIVHDGKSIFQTIADLREKHFHEMLIGMNVSDLLEFAIAIRIISRQGDEFTIHPRYRKCLTPKELYAMSPNKVTSDMHFFANSDLIKEARVHEDDLWDVKCPNIQLKYLQDHCFDGERSWTLLTVWYEGIPVAVMRNAGRGGAEYPARFITNSTHFLKMCAYIEDCVAAQHGKKDLDDVVDENDDQLDDMTFFYGKSLTDDFEYW